MTLVPANLWVLFILNTNLFETRHSSRDHIDVRRMAYTSSEERESLQMSSLMIDKFLEKYEIAFWVFKSREVNAEAAMEY